MNILLIVGRERESDSCYISSVIKKKETSQQKWAKQNHDKLAAACRRWRKRHPERQKAATYRWRRKHLAEWNGYQRRWRRKNRDRTNQLLRSKRALLRDAYNAKRRDYRRRNLSKLRSAARLYYWKNWERKRIEHHAAVAKRRGAPGKYTKQEWLQLLAAYRYRCAYCNRKLTRKTASADHVVPLGRGGTNWIANIVPSCLSCNQRKNFLTAKQFLARLRKKNRRQ
jgi:5-methylcytosine-specific restriction endonuclease McrA